MVYCLAYLTIDYQTYISFWNVSQALGGPLVLGQKESSTTSTWYVKLKTS